MVTEARLTIVLERRGARDARAVLVVGLSRTPALLELHALEHDSTRLEILEGRLEDELLDLVPVPAPRPGRAWRAAVGRAVSDGPAKLVLSYRVEGAVRALGGGASLLAPVVLPRLRGGPARPELFVARLPLPEGHTSWETFPSVEPIRSGETTLDLALPVLPGLVRLDSGPGPPPLLAPARLADALTLGALALLGAIGLIALRRPPERRGE